MSQTAVNTAPLFQTSLREWQATWKNNRLQDGNRSATAPRPGRLARRPHRASTVSSQS
jgi:hypothetical protein